MKLLDLFSTAGLHIHVSDTNSDVWIPYVHPYFLRLEDVSSGAEPQRFLDQDITIGENGDVLLVSIEGDTLEFYFQAVVKLTAEMLENV